MNDVEIHPLKPFLPSEATMLFLGSFPPPKARWSMEFFYPNWINDFWRIMGLIHYGDKSHFEYVDGEKRFDKARIVEFSTARGLAFYDTASKVRRLRGNASDEFLEIVESADIAALLGQMPHCHTIVTTGGKASDELRALLMAETQGTVAMPKIGENIQMTAYDRQLRWWRMPSSSRAYPLRLEKKAEFYQRLFP